MSFFQEMIDEFKQEIQKELAVFDIQPTKKAPQSGQTSSMPDSGVIEHKQSTPVNTGRKSTNTGVRITDSSSTKKQRKKTPQKKSTSTSPRPQAQTQAQQPAQPQTQTQKSAQGHAHHLVANLNPQTARNAIIMAEIIGPPVSRRQRKRV